MLVFVCYYHHGFKQNFSVGKIQTQSPFDVCHKQSRFGCVEQKWLSICSSNNQWITWRIYWYSRITWRIYWYSISTTHTHIHSLSLSPLFYPMKYWNVDPGPMHLPTAVKVFTPCVGRKICAGNDLTETKQTQKWQNKTAFSAFTQHKLFTSPLSTWTQRIS